MSALAGQLDFTLPACLLAALAAALLQPLFLLVLTRLPALAGRNALQFLLSAAIAAAAWAGALALVPSWRPAGTGEAVLGMMSLGAGMLAWLEIWGLLSRGYTLAVLLTLHGAGASLSVEQIRERYRGGDGLAWILRHRLAAMLAAGVVERQGDRLALTPVRGALVARLYRLGGALLGLRRAG